MKKIIQRRFAPFKTYPTNLSALQLLTQKTAPIHQQTDILLISRLSGNDLILYLKYLNEQLDVVTLEGAKAQAYLKAIDDVEKEIWNHNRTLRSVLNIWNTYYIGPEDYIKRSQDFFLRNAEIKDIIFLGCSDIVPTKKLLGLLHKYLGGHRDRNVINFEVLEERDLNDEDMEECFESFWVDHLKKTHNADFRKVLFSTHHLLLQMQYLSAFPKFLTYGQLYDFFFNASRINFTEQARYHKFKSLFPISSQIQDFLKAATNYILQDAGKFQLPISEIMFDIVITYIKEFEPVITDQMENFIQISPYHYKRLKSVMMGYYRHLIRDPKIGFVDELKIKNGKWDIFL